MNWNQTGMPSALVSRLGQKRELSEFKAVLSDAQNHVRHPVDATSMAQELVQSGGREFVEMVKELTTALENAEKELADANRRYERLTADLERRGISIAEAPQPQLEEKEPSADDGSAVWEEWDRRFRALLG